MSRQTKYPKYDLLGVEVDALTIDQALAEMGTLIPKRRASYVVKPYVEFLDTASRSAAIRQTLNQAELCLPDGVGLIWAAHYLYGGPRRLLRLLRTTAQVLAQPDAIRQPLPERFGGIDFTWRLLQDCQQQGHKVYLIGSPQGRRIVDVSTTLTEKLPGLKIVGQFSGYIEGKLPALLQQLDSLRPDVILIGMGFPRQEQLMAHLASRLKQGVMVGEGGSFDYAQFGGPHRRAPQLLRRSGLEWLWRLLQQPGRLRRQLAIPRFIWKVYRQGQHLPR